MFRTPVRLNLYQKETSDSENSENTPQYPTPKGVLISKNSKFPESNSPSPYKRPQSVNTTEICLRTELGLVKNDLELEKNKNQEFLNEIRQLNEKIEKFSKAVNEKKGENRVLKHTLNEIKTESELENKKFFTQIEVLKQENLKLSKKLTEYQFAETQIIVIQQELEEKYKNKYLRLKQNLKSKLEVLKKKEKDLAAEKLKFSSTVSTLLTKFENLDTKFPGLKSLLP